MEKSCTCSGCGETGGTTVAGVSGTGLCLLVMPHLRECLRELVEKFHSFMYLFIYISIRQGA